MFEVSYEVMKNERSLHTEKDMKVAICSCVSG